MLAAWHGWWTVSPGPRFSVSICFTLEHASDMYEGIHTWQSPVIIPHRILFMCLYLIGISFIWIYQFFTTGRIRCQIILELIITVTLSRLGCNGPVIIPHAGLKQLGITPEDHSILCHYRWYCWSRLTGWVFTITKRQTCLPFESSVCIYHVNLYWSLVVRC